MKLHLISLIIFLSSVILAQTKVTTIPAYPSQTDQITITFDVTNTNPDGKTPLINYTGSVYAHTGVYINNDESTWKYVIGSWGNNTLQPLVSYDNSPNRYKIVIDNPRSFYKVTDGSQNITKLCFVLRSSDGTKQTEDIKIPLYSSGISVVFNTPLVNLIYGDPMRTPVFVSAGGKVPISVSTTAVGTTQSVKLYVNGILKIERNADTLTYTYRADEYGDGKNEVNVVATDIGGLTDSKTFVIMRNPVINNLPIPSGSQIGVNYNTRVLALYAPGKKFIYLIGDHSDWKVDTSWFMNRDNSTPDSLWWIGMPSMTADPAGEIGYQFLIDGELRIYDPYTDKILDKDNDQYIPSTVYPNLKSYPKDKTSGIVSVLQPAKSQYNWNVSNFIRPPKEKLVIYELLVRDFVKTHSYKTLVDTLSYFKKLGVNAIELMPISEFEGNDSWGYNPMTYFAPDKYYGTVNDLKSFIDACHQNGIAVIQDIVLNHAYNSNSMAQMYWDKVNNRPAANNPWFNPQSNFGNPSAQWGNDFNHESLATQYFIDRVLKYWITEFKIDGFRFDFTKGFGNNYKDQNTDSWGSKYDTDRIRLLKRMADKIWSYDPTSILIFEHLADNPEDQELALHGILMWGNINNNYNEATMGYLSNSNFGGVSYKSRSWTAPNLVGYMESHDEQRLMFKNLNYGTSGSYSTKNLTTALNRIKLAATFFITVPGPKMIWQFGELGYDIPIDFNGRLGPKPVPWADGLNYYSDADRKNLFNTFASLIRLKKAYPAFSSSDFTLFAAGAVKTLYINDISMNVAIVGNFDVTPITEFVPFQNTGTWYEFFTGDSLNVSTLNMQFNLAPGEYRLYTSKKIPKADIMVNVREDKSLPMEFVLEQNYPNPFNPETTISYQLSEVGNVKLKIFDVLGREVATLINETKAPGRYQVIWNGKDNNGRDVTSGVYLYKIYAGNFTQSKKMILMK